jgi:hypothetical protein
VLALGTSSSGETHIALALGLVPCHKGQRVQSTTAASLVNELIEAKDEKRLRRGEHGCERSWSSVRASANGGCMKCCDGSKRTARRSGL